MATPTIVRKSARRAHLAQVEPSRWEFRCPPSTKWFPLAAASVLTSLSKSRGILTLEIIVYKLQDIAEAFALAKAAESFRDYAFQQREWRSILSTRRDRHIREVGSLLGSNTVGKQHFTQLYNQARRTAFTPRNIKSGWAKAGLYLFNPDRVLRDIEKPLTETVPSDGTPEIAPSGELLKTPVTAENLASLRRMMDQKIHTLDDESQ
ncbi:uncharacterized protein A1O9_13056 [Exophiala aquamarina CBS 119918]|uniref:Uncharacterized protein n=1 Tax=Exophiala aquamarina CBS 119918 TaxID=1182545 RepID=A0A072NTD8_9EURO|nr:uncharacterized protein A1O9_13056 [Exophiala aquamarina CBS 119918]KEF50896.1 hypothetical protein A1O9_13056 [Exophiala aquamarina CBS 119918]